MCSGMQFNADAYYNPSVRSICSATAYASAYASSANAQAKLVKGIWENTCSPYGSLASNGELDFGKHAQAWANAYVSVRSSESCCGMF